MIYIILDTYSKIYSYKKNALDFNIYFKVKHSKINV